MGIVLSLAGLPAMAQNAAPQSQEVQAQDSPTSTFQAKRVRPPKPGTQKLITIQIDPDAAAPADQYGATGNSGQSAQQERVAAVPQAYEWFWAEMSPTLAAANPGRVDAALTLLEARPDVPSPRLADMQAIVQSNGVDILMATLGTRVSPALVLAVIAVESAGNPEALSGAGAQGLMQLMPDTARDYGVQDAFDPRQNITAGVAFLDDLMARFGEDPLLVLAAYNAGPGAVENNAGVPDYPETRAYVPKVMQAYRTSRGMCQTVPLMVTDGCVFQTLNR